jgi:phosphoribosylamine-glycine ligase
VIKNPLCSPGSPIHTIVCETAEDTLSWLPRLNYAEGVFLQEYLGRAEAGHIALVSEGKVHSLVTNQEYKRAFAGNIGIVAGAPLGGLIERDEKDRYGLAAELLRPLEPWFKEVNFTGPVQVTAIRKNNRWHVLEYNVRLGVTSGPMILRILQDPMQCLLAAASNKTPETRFVPKLRYGCSLTLAGYGYPFVQTTGPALPVELAPGASADIWWNEVASSRDKLLTTGHRIADVNAIAPTLKMALQSAYAGIQRIRCLGSYFRPDVGQSLWPPGHV